jgi:hypothetical protein
MKLAIMQPYLFPYIGYFQLIHAVDAFVVYDDVNYIKRGWINRNNLLAKGKAELFTLETSGASLHKLINEIGVGGNRLKLLTNIRHKYCKAPFFLEVFPLIEGILHAQEDNLAKFLTNSLQIVCRYLGLEPNWYVSSELGKIPGRKGQDKILNICDLLKADHYINPPGGRDLYDRELFANCGINLSFLRPSFEAYPQFGAEFVPFLSIIDVMMFNDRISCEKLLEDYSLD